MGKIIVSENVTLDGVVQDPTGEEGLAGGGWFLRMTERDWAEWGEVEQAEAREAVGLLLGRGTDAWFADRWLTREGEWAERLNGMPKYVVSSTITEPRWSSATGFKGAVLSGDVAKEVARLKEELTGDLLVFGSVRLVRALLEQGLVDELRLTLHPAVAGEGERLFAAGSAALSMELVSARPLGERLVHLVHRPVTRP